MKTTEAIPDVDTKKWASVRDLARCFHCSTNAVHIWGRAGEFGYRQLGPKKFVACISEAVKFYTSKFPNVEIDHQTINTLMQSSA